jgi:quercetin dioxygenase-like cupin family protein
MGAFDNLKRVIVPETRFRSEELSPGVMFHQLHPGGKAGPNGEVGGHIPGGQAWSEHILVGDPADPFQMLVPDIRMPPNQLWPLHWHDCWTVVLVLEGECVVGDWLMRPGDVFITEPSIEYGPLLNGPHGCRLLEIFARAHLSPGGYSPEYRDHPTLQGGQHVYKPRSVLNRRNEGRQVLPLAGVAGTWCERFEPGREWSLGAADDPDRGFMRATRFAPGETIAAHSYGDWRFMLVLDGAVDVAGRRIERDGCLLARPQAVVGEITAGAGGARLLELARTARGRDRQPVRP